jgi:hypothetical protein
MDGAYILFGIAVLSIILGFVALLSQKIYLDATTKQPTEVDIPFLGKLKSNYPALVFVFLGAALAFYAFQKSFPPPNEEWTLKGRFTPPEGKTVDTTGTLTLFQDPVVVRNTIDAHGRFEITVNIPKGKSVEEDFETLNYTYSDGSAQIDLRKEYNAFLKNQASKIENATEHQRIFKDVPITVYPPLGN